MLVWLLESAWEPLGVAEAVCVCVAERVVLGVGDGAPERLLVTDAVAPWEPVNDAVTVDVAEPLLR